MSEKAVSDKISYLVREEGKPQDQAVAIALSMQRRGQLDAGCSVCQRIFEILRIHGLL